MRPSIILTLILAAGILGCRKGDSGGGAPNPGAEEHSHGAGELHEHEEKTAQITVWSDQYEIFAEHTPPVAGKATRFITHVSNIRTGEPRSSGPVKFILKQGSTQFEHLQAAPERAGIYIPALTFPAAGDWHASVIIPGETNATIDFGPIKVFQDDSTAAHAEYPDPPEGISFLKEQQWRIRLKTIPASRNTVVQQLSIPATTTAAPETKATVHSPVVGRLLITTNTARLGSSVRAGDVIGWIEPSFGEFTANIIQAEADLVRAEVDLEQAERLFARNRALYEQQAKSEREFQETEVAYRSAQAAFDAAKKVQALYQSSGATLSEGSVRIALKAPIDGKVDKAPVSFGERITPEDSLFTIINTSSIYVQGQVAEANLEKINPTLGASLQLNAGGPVLTNELEFVSFGQELDRTTRTAPLTYRLGSPPGSIPVGSIVTLLVPTGKSVDAITVPSSAVVEEEGVPVVFVQVSGETFQKGDIQIGVQNATSLEAMAGLAEGERVVTDGAYALLLSTKSGTIPEHGHSH